jgi:hypothetical protein
MASMSEHEVQMDKRTKTAREQLQTETSFGAYAVILRTGEQLPEPIREWLALKRNDIYLEVHVPNSVKGSPRRVLRSFRGEQLNSPTS